nr:toprim domain-containing protein [Enterococcus hirae]
MFQKNIFDEEKEKTRNVDLTAFLVFFISHYRYFLYGCSSDPYKENYFGAKKVFINTEFCAMSGLKHQVVEAYFRKVLESNRKLAEGKKTIVPRISLCVNNDEAGREFVDRFKKYLAQKGYSETFINYNVRQELPVSQLGKSESFDYNDLLKETNHLKTVDQSMMVQEEYVMEQV